MSLIRRIAGERRADSFATTPAGWLLNALGGGKTASGQVVTPATAEGIPVIYACVSILAETVAQLPLKLYRVVPAGQVPDTKHSLYAVLHDLANPFMTSAEFREVMLKTQEAPEDETPAEGEAAETEEPEVVTATDDHEAEDFIRRLHLLKASTYTQEGTP